MKLSKPLDVTNLPALAKYLLLTLLDCCCLLEFYFNASELECLGALVYSYFIYELL